jgi:hypothetical protein
MVSTLYQTNMYSWIFIVLTDSPRVDMLLNSDTVSETTSFYSYSLMMHSGEKYKFYSLWFDPTGSRTHDLPHSRRADDLPHSRRADDLPHSRRADDLPHSRRARLTITPSMQFVQISNIQVFCMFLRLTWKLWIKTSANTILKCVLCNCLLPKSLKRIPVHTRRFMQNYLCFARYIRLSYTLKVVLCIF